MPSLAALLVVRNEADLLGLTLAHLLRTLRVSQVRVIDNGSTDATPALLASMAAREPRLTWRVEAGPFHQGEMLTALAEEARAAGADWLLPLDADEFLDPPAGGLAPVLTAAAAEVAAFWLPVRNFVQWRGAGRRPKRALESMVFSAEPWGTSSGARALIEEGTIPFLRMRYPHKLLLRAAPGLALRRGNHWADGIAGHVAVLPGAELLHAPIPTRARLRQRVAHGARVHAMLTDPEISWHLRRLRDFGEAELRREWRRNTTLWGTMPGPGGWRGLRWDTRLRRIARAHREAFAAP